MPCPFPPAAANQSKRTEDTHNALLHQRCHFPQLFIVRFLCLTHCHEENTSSSLTVVFSIPYPPAAYKEYLLSELTARNPNGKVSVTRPKHRNRQKKRSTDRLHIHFSCNAFTTRVQSNSRRKGEGQSQSRHHASFPSFQLRFDTINAYTSNPHSSVHSFPFTVLTPFFLLSRRETGQQPTCFLLPHIFPNHRSHFKMDVSLTGWLY